MQDFESYYTSNRARFESLSSIARGLIENLLRQKSVEFLSLEARPKSLSSCIQKIERKSYRDPINQITDIVGVRIILYFEHQIPIVSNFIREMFCIDNENSFDQNNKLGSDRIGYRSNHLVCHLGEARSHLNEYQDIHQIKFEVQIRTILQHAWAELAHDRSYKLSGGLPTEIQRDVNLYAGLLEIADKSFSRIIIEIDQYVDNLDDSKLANEEINVLSLGRYIESIARKFSIKLTLPDGLSLSDVVDEVREFGLKRISDLDPLIDEDLLAHTRLNGNTSIGFIRDALLNSNLEKYIRICLNNRWGAISEMEVRWLSRRNPSARQMLEEAGILVIDDEEPNHEDSD